MAYEYGGDRALDYFPCRYGQSKLLFRGPRRKLEGNYISVLGGTATYGKFVPDPYPALLEKMLDRPVVNFGYMNAGTDVFVSEPAIIEACSKAQLTVIQLMGAQNMSNRFYAVHPRRNDRFLRASLLMKTIFREVDFTEFHFTRHMLSTLKAQASEKFALVEEELKSAWVARMRLLLQKIGGRSLLLWVGDYRLDADGHDGLGPEPLMVDSDMIAAVKLCATEVVQIDPSLAARQAGIEGMHFSPLEEPIAQELPGPRIHQEVADALAPVLRSLL